MQPWLTAKTVLFTRFCAMSERSICAACLVRNNLTLHTHKVRSHKRSWGRTVKDQSKKHLHASGTFCSWDFGSVPKTVTCVVMLNLRTYLMVNHHYMAKKLVIWKLIWLSLMLMVPDVLLSFVWCFNVTQVIVILKQCNNNNHYYT